MDSVPVTIMQSLKLPTQMVSLNQRYISMKNVVT